MRKRQRGDDEQQQPDYGEDREPAAYSYGGSSQRSDGSGSRCDPELVSYLTVSSAQGMGVSRCYSSSSTAASTATATTRASSRGMC
jgi:hypothetical protein